MERWDALIVGGGWYGLHLAAFLATRLPRVLLCERAAGLMPGPSGQPTAVRSAWLLDEFRAAVVPGSQTVYAGTGEDINALRRAGLPVEPADDAVKALFDPALVTEVVRVRESVLDPAATRELLTERARRAGVEVRVNARVERVRPLPGGSVRVTVQQPGAEMELTAGAVVCCTGSRANAVAAASGLPVIPLELEIAETVLVGTPPGLRGLAVVVPGVFSCLPHGGVHAVQHARHSRHGHWYDGLPAEPYLDADGVLAAAQKRTAFGPMIRDAARFVPALAGCAYRDSLWEARTALPGAVVFPDHDIPNYHVVPGGAPDGVAAAAAGLAVRFGWTTDRPAARDAA